MLKVRLTNDRQQLAFEHETGPLEFGRGPRDEFERCIVEDLSVSRDQMRVVPLPDGRLRIDNLSGRVAIRIRDHGLLNPGEHLEQVLPVDLAVGNTTIALESPQAAFPHGETDVFVTIAKPVARSTEVAEIRKLLEENDAPDAETLTRWFETVVRVQQAAATSAEFYQQTAAAVVELVGLDEGLVLVRNDGEWLTASHHGEGTVGGEPYSQRIIDFVVQERRTFYRDLSELSPTASLENVSAAVASPIFGSDRSSVVGVVYGRRGLGGRPGPPVRSIEAQLLQVLAAAVGAGLRRMEKEAEASQWRFQLESFFTPRLVEELERNPNMLDGNEREVTILFADLRGFTRCTARLGAAAACRLVGDVMEHLSDVVLRHDGVIIDYYGDGVLAMWNAPVVQADHADRAVTAALEIMAELPQFGRDWEAKLGEPLALGVGVNTGSAVVGNVGSQRKFKYGALGLAVNLAQRIESVTKLVGCPVLASGSSVSAMRRPGKHLRVGRFHLSGAIEPIDLHVLLHEGESTLSDTAVAEYALALAAFESGEWCRTVEVVANSTDLREIPLGKLIAERARELGAAEAAAEAAVLDLRPE